MKTTRIKRNFFQRLSLRESWVIFFILGIIMLDYPFLHIFNKDILVYRMPLFFLYLIIGWAISILVIYLFTKSIKPENDNNHGSEQ